MHLRLVVFVVGAASLGAEIAAARLLAPWFGASTIVWANTIATVLVALSVGYALGGRAADRDPTLAGLSRVVLVAGVLLACVPFASGPLLSRSLTAFAHLSAGLFVGSLVGVSVLVAVPVLLLGMVSPYAVRLALDALTEAGRTTGRLYAVSTLGSLVGTFAAALLLIPAAGTRRTFLAFALALVLVALPGLVRRPLLAAAGAAGAVAIVVLALLPEGVVKSSSAQGRVIWERETEYQYARVIQEPDRTRFLELNEGQAVHSVYTPGRWLPGGYWDHLTALGLAARGRQRVAILGSAAGTVARAIGHYSPGTRIDAVELDPAVTRAGRELFDLRAPHLRTYAADARPWLQTSRGRYDAILVDAYRQPYIPFYLATREFFALARAHLRPGGLVVVNVGQPAGATGLERALTASARAAFGLHGVRRDPVDATNTMLVAGAPSTLDGLRAHLRRLAGDAGSPGPRPGASDPTALRATDRTVAGRLGPGRRGGPVWTDDRAPVEWLVDLSLAGVATHRTR